MSNFGYRLNWYDTKRKCVHLRTWDDQGNRIEVTEPFKPYLYIESMQAADAVSIFGTNLKKISFPSEFERRRYLKDCGIKRIFGRLKVEQQYLLEKYIGLNDSFEPAPLKIFYLDIECHSPSEFPKPEEAKFPIDLMTIFDSLSNKFYTFGLKPFTSTGDNVYVYCKSEVELLTKFLDFWGSDYPDVLTGWNSEGFDIPYIINRIKNILGEEEAKRLSPYNSLYYKEDIGEKYGKTVGKWCIHGVNCVDYKEIYEKFTREKRERYSLDYISRVELKEGKTEFNATSLSNLALTDWNKYVEYNIQDVNLLIKLEEKLRYLKIMRLIANKGFCNLEDTLGKITFVSGAISAQALKHNKIFCTFEHDDMGNYAGGFVKDIESGLFSNIITFDADSLYPNTIITLNLSPETKLGKVIATDRDKDTITIRLESGKIHTLSTSDFLNFVKKEKISISKAKILFSQKEKGIVPEYEEALYAERVQNSEIKDNAEKDAKNYAKGSPEYIKLRTTMEQADILQYTLKIILNSIYGVFGNSHSPLYDTDCAASITNTGQAVIKEAGNILDRGIKEFYDIDIVDSTFYNDTDSTHLSITPILEKLNIPLLMENDQIDPRVYDISNKLNDYLNKEINEWSRGVLNSTDSRFNFKREAICPSGLYQSKKHYILHIRDKGKRNPMPCNKIKPVGVELVKTTMSNSVKKMLEELVMTILNTKDESKAIEKYREIFDAFQNLPLEEISFIQGVKTFDKYNSKVRGFEKAKSTPVAVAGAIYHNILLKEYNIEDKYEKLNSGDRVNWFYCTRNKYNINNISYKKEYPKELLVDIKPDYKKMFEKIMEPAVDRLFDCAHWKKVYLYNEYAVNLLDFFKS